MNIFGRTIIPIFLAAVLASCNSVAATPTMSQADIMETAIATVSTAFAKTQRTIPTNTPFPLPTISFNTLNTLTPSSVPTLGPTSTPLAFTDPSIPLSERIVYYYPVWHTENPTPKGIVNGFAPTYADQTYSSNTAADLRTALEIVLHVDSRRVWDSTDLEIADITFRNGHADVVIEGQAFSAGDAQPCAASLQILMTVFANPSVQTATVTLNGGGPITNLCFFGPPTPPIIPTVNDVYARADVETYMDEHAYVSP